MQLKEDDAAASAIELADLERSVALVDGCGLLKLSAVATQDPEDTMKAVKLVDGSGIHIPLRTNLLSPRLCVAIRRGASLLLVKTSSS